MEQEREYLWHIGVDGDWQFVATESEAAQIRRIRQEPVEKVDPRPVVPVGWAEGIIRFVDAEA